MNGIRCPNCDLVNQLSALQCQQCGMPFGNLPATAYVSVPVEETYEARAFGENAAPTIPQDNELGRKTFFWYRIYCGVLLGFSLLCLIGGLFLAIAQPNMPDTKPGETLFIGLFYAVAGGISVVIYAVATFLPAKPYNWIVGIVIIAFGMTSCCFMPFLIPLLIFWMKPETKAFLGRK